MQRSFDVVVDSKGFGGGGGSGGNRSDDDDDDDDGERRHGRQCVGGSGSLGRSRTFGGLPRFRTTAALERVLFRRHVRDDRY
jgi:hypothetical protein